MTIRATRICMAAAMSAIALAVPGGGSGAIGQEAPTCDGKPATIFFPTTKEQGSTLTGTNGDDVIVTGPGQETVHGLRGDDTICTRGGRDTIFGGRGDDKLFGERGKDKLYGKRGLDRAIGGANRDLCHAERERGCER